jgi:hypothetical protein
LPIEKFSVFSVRKGILDDALRHCNHYIPFHSYCWLPGDFNNDGIMDAADYVVWRNGVGTRYTHDHFNEWRTNFGRTQIAGSGAALFSQEQRSSLVPEPTSGLQLVVFGVTARVRIRNPRRRELITAVQCDMCQQLDLFSH